MHPSIILFFVLSFFAIGTYLFKLKAAPSAANVFVLYFIASVLLPYLTRDNIDPYTDNFSKFLLYEGVHEAFAYLMFVFVLTSFVYRLYLVSLPTNIYVSRAFAKDNLVAIRFAVISIALSLLYSIISILIYGDVTSFLLSTYKRVQSGSSISNFKSILYWGAAVFALLAFYFSSNNKSRNYSFCALLLALILSLSNGGRSVFILFIFAILYKRILIATTRKFIIFSSVFFVFILIASYSMILLRYIIQDATILETNDSGSFALAATGLRYLDHFIVSTLYADWRGHDYGELYKNAFLSFIPRGIWEGKPQLISAELRYYLYGDYTGGVPPGLFGEAYISAGIFGLFVISNFYGILLAWFDNQARKARRTLCPFKISFLGFFIPLIGFTLVRGGIDIGVFRLGIPLFWFLVAYIWLRSQSRLRMNIVI